jgi:hypothetical protein
MLVIFTDQQYVLSGLILLSALHQQGRSLTFAFYPTIIRERLSANILSHARFMAQRNPSHEQVIDG